MCSASVAVTPTLNEAGQQPTLSIKWDPDRIFAPFFRGGTAIYNSTHQVTFCLNNDSISVMDPTCSSFITRIGDSGDPILCFAVSDNGSIVVAACRSLLIRVWKLNWSRCRHVNGKTEKVLVDNDGNLFPVTSPSYDNALGFEILAPATQIKTWKGPSSVIRSVAIDPLSNSLLAVATVNGSINVYNIEGGFCTHSFPKQNSRIGLVKFHPSRSLLFSTYEDGIIRIYDLYRHVCISRLVDHLSLPTDLDFIQTTDGSLGGLISSSRDRIVNVWSFSQLDQVLTDEVNRLASKVKTKTLDSCKLIKAGQSLSSLEVELSQLLIEEGKTSSRKKPKQLEYSGNDEEMLSGTALPSVNSKAGALLWLEGRAHQLSDSKPIHQLAMEEEIETLLCVPTNLLSNCQIIAADKTLKPIATTCTWIIITGGESGRLTLWSPSLRQKLASIDTPHRGCGRILSLAQHRSPFGYPRILSVGEDQNLVFWDVSQMRVERLLLGNPTELIQCQFVPIPVAHSCTYLSIQNGKQVNPNFVGSEKKDKKNEKDLIDNLVDTPGDGNVHCDSTDDAGIERDEDERTLIPYQRSLILRSDKNISLLEMSEGRVGCSIVSGHEDIVLCADVSSDGCWILSGSKDQTLRITSSRIEKSVAILRGHTSPVVAVQFNKKRLKNISCTCLLEGPGTTPSSLPVDPLNGGLFAVSVCLEGMLKLWKLDANQLRNQLSRHVSNQSSEQVILEPVNDVTMERNILEMGESCSSVLAHDEEIHSLAIAPNDKYVATSSSDKTIKIWKLPKLEHLGTCRGHRRAVWAVKFSPFEQVVASSSSDQTIKLWSLKDFSCLKTFQGHCSSVLGVEFITLGTQLLSSSSNGQIKLWNIRTSDCVATFDKHDSQKVWSISLDTQRQRLLSCGSDNKLIVWKDVTHEVDREQLEQRQLEAEQAFKIEAFTREGKVLEALTLSVRLNRPYQTRSLLKRSFETFLFDHIEEDLGKDPSIATGAIKQLIEQLGAHNTVSPITEKELSYWMYNLNDDDLKRFLEFVLKWNTNSQTASLSNALMSIIIKSIPSDRLLKVEGFPNIAANFLSYLPRHTNRLSALIQRTFILDMILFTCGSQSITDIPDLPDRECKSSSLSRKAAHDENALSLADAYDVIFN